MGLGISDKTSKKSPGVGPGKIGGIMGKAAFGRSDPGKLDKVWYTHLNRNKIEYNLSVPGIHGRHENALIKSIEMSPHMMCLYASIKIPLGPASG